MSKKIYKNADLPVYEIYIDEEEQNTGIRFISLVESPATESIGVAFGKDEDVMSFKKVDQQRIAGYGMIPDKLIFRRDKKRGDYFVKFSKDTIKSMMMRFNKFNNNKSINVDHTEQIVDAFVAENWISEDSYYDKSKLYGIDPVIGGWFLIVQIEDQKFWDEKVKGEGRYSFSIEGLMSHRPETYSKIDQMIDNLSDDEVLSLFEDLKKKKN